MDGLTGYCYYCVGIHNPAHLDRAKCLIEHLQKTQFLNLM